MQSPCAPLYLHLCLHSNAAGPNLVAEYGYWVTVMRSEQQSESLRSTATIENVCTLFMLCNDPPHAYVCSNKYTHTISGCCKQLVAWCLHINTPRLPGARALLRSSTLTSRCLPVIKARPPPHRMLTGHQPANGQPILRRKQIVL